MKNLIRFDWAVKRLLRNKANFGILEGFLSELLQDDIKIDHILESEGNRQTANNKTNRVDMLVQNAKGELIIIEVQNDYKQDYLLRMYYGTSKLVVDNLDKGMDYSKISKVISINIVYFDLGRGDDYIYHGTTSFKGLHKNDTLTLSPAEENLYHTIEIAKVYPEYYIIKVNQFDVLSDEPIDHWINFFKNQEVKEGTKARGLKEAMIELNVMKLNEEERLEYESYIKDWRDDYATIVGNYNKGKIEGKIEGEIEERIKVVKNLHKKGMTISFISEITGLNEGEIQNIIDVR